MDNHIYYMAGKNPDIKTAHCWLITFKISLKKSLNTADTSYMELNWSYLFTTMLNECKLCIRIFGDLWIYLTEFSCRSSRKDLVGSWKILQVPVKFLQTWHCCESHNILEVSTKILIAGASKIFARTFEILYGLRVLCITEYPIGSLAEFHQ